MTTQFGRRPLRLLIFATAIVALLLAGCSEDNQVGSRELTDFEQKQQGRLGSTTTAAAAPTTTAAAQQPGEQTTTTRAAPATTAKPATKGYEIKIQSDQSSTQFEPRVAQVFTGTPVTWTNTDSVPRSVEFADQSYVSGPIAPGASATFTANRAGEFNYSDGTRPYAVGTLRVQAR